MAYVNGRPTTLLRDIFLSLESDHGRRLADTDQPVLIKLDTAGLLQIREGVTGARRASPTH
jgi:hypothetical protein